MQLRNILVAATLAALPAAVNAQPVNGVYVGAGVGINKLMDMGVSNAPGAKYSANLGVAALGAVGYGFGGGLRAELEGNFRTAGSKLVAANGVNKRAGY